MSTTFVRVGLQVVNPSFVAGANWENGVLYVHLVGGRFQTFRGDQAKAMWRVFSDESFDLLTGSAGTTSAAVDH